MYVYTCVVCVHANLLMNCAKHFVLRGSRICTHLFKYIYVNGLGSKIFGHANLAYAICPGNNTLD